MQICYQIVRVRLISDVQSSFSVWTPLKNVQIPYCHRLFTGSWHNRYIYQTPIKCSTDPTTPQQVRKLIILIKDCLILFRSRQYQAADTGSNNENSENSESTEGSKQAETPEWERARQALAKVNTQITKSPVKSKTNNSNTTNAASTIQQQTLAYQQYYQYYQTWGGYAPYSYQYPGYVPAFTMPPPQANVPPTQVSVLLALFMNMTPLYVETNVAFYIAK